MSLFSGFGVVRHLHPGCRRGALVLLLIAMGLGAHGPAAGRPPLPNPPRDGALVPWAAGEATGIDARTPGPRPGTLPVRGKGPYAVPATSAASPAPSAARPPITVDAVPVEPLTFTHLAGSTTGAGAQDGVGSAARFNIPSGIVVDAAGNSWVTDEFNSTIRRVTSAGSVTTFAGLAGEYAGVDGVGASARFSFSKGITMDAAGTLYVADSGSHTVRRVSPAGVVSTLAGLAGAYGYADGTGTAARFLTPMGAALDAAGNLYVADRGNHAIRKVTPGGTVSTLAGLAGTYGSADGIGTAARFRSPSGVAADANGNLFVSDEYNHTIRKIVLATGQVTTLAGLAGSRGSADGIGTAARFRYPEGLTSDAVGNVYVADSRNHTVRKVAPDGTVSTVAGLALNIGSADGIGTAARFSWPSSVFVQAGSTLHVTDEDNYTIRKIVLATGEVTTLAGYPPTSGFADGTGSGASFNWPWGVEADPTGDVFVADTWNSAIRKIAAYTGIVTTLAGSPWNYGGDDGIGSSASFAYPADLAADGSGNLYVADYGGSTIRKIVTSSAQVTTLAGSFGNVGSEDGTGAAASFSYPRGIDVDSSGTAFVADEYNHTVRRVTPSGVVTTIAGLAGVPGSADGAGSVARFNYPSGVAVDVSGNVYVADARNYTLRRITTSGGVSTVAGLAGSPGSADGVGSAARFGTLGSIAVDSSGNVWVADYSAATIRKVTPGGTVTTVGGRGYARGGQDGTSSAARFFYPAGVAVTPDGRVLVADESNHAIRVGRTGLPDVATVDLASGAVGLVRHLGSSPQTASSWSWIQERIPTGSTAVLSSTSLPNPTFTPDVAGYYVFRLTASGGSQTSITTVGLSAGTIAPPTATVSGGGTICPGQFASIEAVLTGTPPWSLTWSDGQVQSGLMSSPATRSVSPGATTVYTVTAVSDAAGPGTTSGSATVTVLAAGLSAVISAPSAVGSLSYGNVASVPDAGPGASYVWTPTNATVTGGNGTRTITFRAGSSGSVGLGVQVIPAAGCSAAASVAIPIVQRPPWGQGAASLLLPAWEVGVNGSITGGDIDPSAIARDTVVRYGNISDQKVISRVTLWNRRGRGVLDFNVPLGPGDFVTFTLADLLNGRLNLNASLQAVGKTDVCTDATWYQFVNPDSSDLFSSISIYATPAYSGSFRARVWDSLDATADDPMCGQSQDYYYQSPFLGALTVDVVNYCTNIFAADTRFYDNDALATVRDGRTVNVLTGTAHVRESSGQIRVVPLVGPRFDPSLDWNSVPTFYQNAAAHTDNGTGHGSYSFVGDGRTPEAGRPGSLYLSATPSFTTSAGATDVTFTAHVMVSDPGAACSGYGCLLGLFEDPCSPSPSGGGCPVNLGNRNVDPYTGLATWTLPVSPTGTTSRAFWVAPTGTCNVCPSCTSNVVSVPVGASSRFNTLAPCRVIDTRSANDVLGGPALAPSQQRLLPVATVCGLPPTARAVSLNVTVTGAATPGFLTLFAGNGAPPRTSTINFRAGQTRANNSVLQLSTDGGGSLGILNGCSSPVHVILDVNGYFE